MARTALDPAILTEIAKGSLRVETMLKLDFPGGAITTTTSPKAISYGGDTYKPDGLLESISGISERIDGKPGLLTFRLRPDSDLKAKLAAGDWQWKKVHVYQVILSESYALIGVAHEAVFLMSTASETIDAGEDAIEMQCEPLIITLARRNAVRPSSVDQALRSPGDSYFDNVATLRGMRFEWGGRAVTYNPGVREHFPGGGGNPLAPPPSPIPSPIESALFGR